MGSGWLRVSSLGVVLLLGCPKPAPTLSSISIAPENALVAQGDSVRFVATGLYSDGAVKTLTEEVSWLVDDALIARVDPAEPGHVEALAPGTTTVRASSGEVRASRTLTVTGATLRFLQVYPPRPVAPVGLEVQLQVFAVHTDQTVENVTRKALWRSSGAALFQVSSGRVVGQVPGLGELSVTYQGALTKVPLTVSSATVQRIELDPRALTLPVGVSQALDATATLSDRSTVEITDTAAWSSDVPAVASVTTSPDEGGQVTALTQGTATITASAAGRSATASVQVTDAVLSQLVVSPAPATAASGTKVDFTATAIFSDGSSTNVTAQATWSTSNAAVASLDGSRASALALGSATITAGFQGLLGSSRLTVSDAQLLRIELSPSSIAVALGTSRAVTATGVFSDGTLQDLTQQAVWTVADPAVATASNAPSARGHVLGLTLGTTTLTAEVGPVSGTAALLVTSAVITKVELAPAAPALPQGTSLRLTATGLLSDGTSQDVTALASWSSSDNAIVSASNATGTRGLVSGQRVGTATVSASFSGLTGSTSVTVSSAVLVTLSLAPSPLTLARGTQAPLVAVGIYSDNSTWPLTEEVTWTSDDASVASVDTAIGRRGQVRANAVGTTTLHAQLGSVTASVSVTVTQAVLVSIEVSPASATVAAGTTRAFVALGTMSDASTQELTSQVTWSSASPVVATISNAVGNHGVALGRAPGTATLTASLSGVSGSATLTVTPALLVALAIEPPSVSLFRGATGSLVARGTFSDGASLDVTDQVTWSSSDEAIVTVSNAAGTQGDLGAASVGQATVTATHGSITADAQVTVTPALLVAIDVSPVAPTAPLGTTLAFTATGRFSDGSVQDVTALASWTSSTPSVASVSNAPGSAGHALAAQQGSSVITASVGSLHGAATMQVTAATLASIALTPSAPRLAPLTATRLTATGTWTDGTTQDLTTQATWASDTPAVAQVSNVAPSQGRVSTSATGDSTISASFGGVVGSTVVTVTGATLLAIDVTPSVPSAPAGLTTALSATGTFSDGTTQSLTELVTWSSTDASRASVSTGPVSFGVVTAVAVGAPTIRATMLGVTGSVTFTVTSALLVAIDVTPASATIPRGLGQAFTATGTFTDGTTAPLSEQVVWTSSNTGVAPISNATGTWGQATGLAVGQATITAALSGKVGTASLTVTTAALVSLAVTPVSPSVPRGLTVQCSATGTFTDGSTQDVTQAATWVTGDGTIAIVSNGGGRGLARGVGVGQTTVTATLGSATDGTTLAVTPAQLVSIGLNPVNPSVPLGLTQQISATGVYTDGTTQDLTNLATWSTSDGTVASVSNAAGSVGLATALELGSATLTATSGGIVGTTHLTVSAAALRTIQVTPPTPSVPAGRTLQLTAIGVYSDTSTQDLTAVVAWSTSAPSTASVSNAPGTQGLASALTEGTATVTASLGGTSGNVLFTVTTAVLQAIQVTPANTARPRGLGQQFTATGVYSDGSTHDVTTSATWTSSAPATVSISNAAGSQGYASAVNVGSVSITATLSGVLGATFFTVTAAELVRVDVTPESSAVPLGSVRQLTATGTYTDGTTQNLTSQASWTSSSPGLVSVSNAVGSQGFATTIAIGTVTVGASVQGFSDSMSMTVTQAALASIELTPSGGSTALGYSRQFIAVGTYTDGTTQVLTTVATWTSGDPSVAFISNGAPTKGLMSTVATGGLTVSATYAGITGATTHTVTPAMLLSIEVSPPTATLTPPATVALTAVGQFSDGSSQELTDVVTWTSSAPGVAQVSNVSPSQGLVTAIGGGTATVTAAYGGISRGAVISVTAQLGP